MNTREKAIQYLQKLGFYAMQRNWVMGETILVATKPKEEEAGKIVSFSRIAYIYPRSNNLWSVDDMKGRNPYAGDCVSLENACEIVIKLLKRYK
ncbi:MAG: hypothetical protein SW833_25430 [Cyanobacteriota bacterium]|nr:hypothetical protein [Cyanobacteriota bacterium]